VWLRVLLLTQDMKLWILNWLFLLILARDLGLWPPDVIIVEEALTAGGSVPIYIIKDEALVSLALNDRFTDNVKCVIVINPYIDKPLISDQLIDALGIIVISIRIRRRIINTIIHY